MSTNDNYLVGNPYPSAINAEKFINDNTGVIDGTLYFWEHVGTANGHYANGYIGGYATLNNVMGLPADTPSIGNNTDPLNGTPHIGAGTYRTPQPSIPIGQGFFVSTTTGSGNINFNNSQREYITEGTNSSIFFKTEKLKYINQNENLITNTKTLFKLGIDYENEHRQRTQVQYRAEPSGS